MFAKAVCPASPSLAYVDLLTQRADYAIDDIYGNACKVTLADRLGAEILTVLEIKGQVLVLHRVRLHVKVPGWLSDLNALLTRKLPKLLSHLNEIIGGRENMCLVSGSLRRILKFFWSQTQTTGKHRAQEIDLETALQTSQNEETNIIPFTLTYHPQNLAIKNVIINNFKILRNDPENIYFLYHQSFHSNATKT